MSSLNTNASAMTALQTLSATNKNLATTQSRIATGFRVAEAQDNAAYWSIATTMRSDNKALSSVQDALGLGAGKVDVAYTGMHSAIEVVDEIKQKLVSAMGSSEADKTKIQTEITELQGQLRSIVNSANYAGSNILSGDGIVDDALDIVSSYDRAADGSVTIGRITIDLNETPVTLGDGDATTGILDEIHAIDLDGADDDSIQGFLDQTEAVLSSMADAASVLGAAKKRVDIQQDFVSKLRDSIDRGVGQLVDADMSKESSKLAALQVQQQLGIQALSIANSNTQNILALFRN
jgi:flagellin